MLNVVMQNVVMQNFIMLIFIMLSSLCSVSSVSLYRVNQALFLYAECHSLSAIMLNVFLLSVAMLKVTAPQACLNAEVLCNLTNRANNAKNNLTVKKGEKQGTLAERENSVPLTTIDKLVQISCFSVEKFILLIYKTSYPSEEVNCTEPFLSASFPW